MPSIDCVDEIDIKASPDDVFKVVADYPNWNSWLPIYNCSLLDSERVEPGAKVRHQYGHKPMILSDFVRSIDAMSPGKSLEESYLEGDLVGKGVWTFKEVGKQTRASYRCTVNSNSFFTHLSFFIMGEKAHKNVYKELLVALKKHCESL